MIDHSYNISLFEMLTEDELEWIAEHSTEVTLQPGEVFFTEGVRDDRFFVVLDGELQVTRAMNGVQRVLGTMPRGVIGGELALLNGTAQPYNSKAIMPTRLLVFDKKTFRDIFACVPVLGMQILRIAAERMSNIATHITHDEKMAALGKFSAGLAHELNNPASAAQRASQTFSDLLPDLLSRSLKLCRIGLEEAHLDRLLVIEREFAERMLEAPALSPLEQSDREDETTDWLDGLGMGASYDIASVFASSGLTVDDLKSVAQELPDSAAIGAIEWLYGTLDARILLCEIDDSATRISDLVHAVKEYTYMDQGKIQEVDIHKSLETTLKVLAHKVKNIEIERVYDPDLPKIMASGTELNQVWTNLIDNAFDVVKDQRDGRIRLITRCESDFVMVEVNDNGEGIPQDALPHIFEPFFTTKGVGEGTGLGLDIVYRIITQHEGSIEAHSQPGNTRFIVRLPLQSQRVQTVAEGEQVAEE